ncbi:MAG: type II toxin-antitoxin system PemK/MazF family toxin, partial [Gemmatimonadaceae bacterium]
DRGDAVWLTFDPQAGHEQAGRRPAVALSPREYNARTGLAIFCPVTSQAKGYPFEVSIPGGLPLAGTVLSDQVRNLDWKARRASRICKLPPVTIDEILGKLATLLVHREP